jgi:hypothetical protein
MKKYSDLLRLVQILNAVGQQANTKAQKKLAKIGELIQEHLDDFNDKKDDIRLESCSVDKDGNIIQNEKGDYSFNKEGVKKLNQAMKELLDSEISFIPIQVSFPEGLEDYTFLEGWVKGVKFNKVEQEEIEL